MEEEEGPFPPPFPKGKEAGYVISRVNVHAGRVWASPLQGRRERGLVGPFPRPLP